MTQHRKAVAVAALLGGLLTLVGPAGASSEAAVRWTSMSESSTCGLPYIGTPIMSRSGFLSDSERLLGPLGGYFGRTLGAVRNDMVLWTVPMSGGSRVLVNRQALPAFQQVSANLAAAQADGRYYSISSIAAYTQRTIGGERQLSRHALGLSIDINPAQNPYSSDPNRLITNMPAWFIEAWTDAGFCWGGSWESAKDPMHFSWMGPTPGSAGLPLHAPSGVEAPYTAAASYDTAWGDLVSSRPVMLADLGGFGSLDVGTLRAHPEGTVIDVVSARSGFLECSHYRWLSDADVAGSPLVAMGDVDSDSRADLVAIDTNGTLTLSRRIDTFEESTVFSDVPLPPDPVQLTIGDWDGDRRGDLWLLGAGGDILVVSGQDFSTVLSEFTLSFAPTSIALGDRDGDGSVEIYAAVDESVVSILTGDGGEEIDRVELADTDLVALAAADQDGDGRSDISRLDATGSLHVAVGNSSTGRPVDGWWRNPSYQCDDDVIPLTWSGTFYDDDTSVFEADIETVAALGITKGCNPPFRDAYCPGDQITRGQMAAFLVRMLGLPTSAADHFTDDDGSEFQEDINRLAEAGITTGCTTTLFCPDDLVSRGQMAAFLVRGLGLVEGGDGNRFVDDDQSVFERDIELLATAGITRGCNPPANDRYCPEASVTRGEMAAFLGRATQID